MMTMVKFPWIEFFVILFAVGAAGFNFRGWVLARTQMLDAITSGEDESNISAAQWRATREFNRAAIHLIITAALMTSLIFRLHHLDEPVASIATYVGMRGGMLAINICMVRETIIDRLKWREIKRRVERESHTRRSSDRGEGEDGSFA